ncbi:unnamed protein product [Parnassius apollo]|uniref:(apollo) hypothetical protein n=1 Tax=Parnassius apollo TaxID=110799 RepID=A0A8S3W2E7_PARAO|nr:unnamed protein product [Parnassius apollo]
MLLKLTILIGSLTGVICRDTRPTKPVPVISHSLVNFGKIDVSFYMNDKQRALSTKKDSSLHPSSSFFSSQHDSPEEEPCPCSSLRGMKDPFVTHPSEILNKILMSNDLFSFNKDLISSTLCCDSHENIQEDGVFLEFSPKQNQMISNPIQANHLLLPSLMNILKNIFPRRPVLPSEPIKSKTIDIYLLPEKKTLTTKDTELFLKKKPDIHAVGDEIKGDIKVVNLTPALSNKSSVKKDLGKNKLEEKEKLPDSETNMVYISTKKPDSV